MNAYVKVNLYLALAFIFIFIGILGYVMGEEIVNPSKVFQRTIPIEVADYSDGVMICSDYDGMKKNKCAKLDSVSKKYLISFFFYNDRMKE